MSSPSTPEHNSGDDLEQLQVGQWLKQATTALAAVDSARLDADLLMCFVLDCGRSALYAWPEKALTVEQTKTLQALLQRRLHGEPIAYLTGEREFWSWEFDVDKNVLVPRPETELIVELALHALKSGCEGPVLDAGTGSGVIAIALYLQWHLDQDKNQNESLSVIASDYSETALTVAKRNAKKLDANKIDFVHSDWLTAFSDNQFGIIVSNPPYLAISDPHLQNNTLGFEPEAALVSGKDGLDAIRTIVSQACRVGKPGCYVLIEHGFEQATEVQNIMRHSNYTQVQTYSDINGLDRTTSGYCPIY